MQQQLDEGNVIKAMARQGDWLLLASGGTSPGAESWLYTGTQRSMDHMLSPMAGPER